MDLTRKKWTNMPVPDNLPTVMVGTLFCIASRPLSFLFCHHTPPHLLEAFQIRSLQSENASGPDSLSDQDANKHSR